MEKDLTDKKNSGNDEQIKVFGLILVRTAELFISLAKRWLKGEKIYK